MKIERKQTLRNNKGLQKLTESESIISSILSLDKITHEDIKELTTEQRKNFSETIQNHFNQLRGEERDIFYKKIEAIMVDDTKNQMWEQNHINIMWAITSHIKENGRMPTKTEIASKTELSRQTVHKHLTDYKNSAYYSEFQEQFHIMQSKVMTTVFQHAINGDMRAAKLYLECIGAFKNNSSTNSNNDINNKTLIQNQNNYIQINGMVLSQETVKNLNPDQLKTIEGILKTIEGKEIEKKN
ncbi:hypothetical protein N0B40_18515 [Chryseobacterium oranimense]|uniref:hypothetical protein n=1 Tax=Chryseobacterium oranimense TaxID=421058 RepID=UPI0021B00D8A|nr:hypothetical protein [Chryseobacterium oranimense]UWX60380.1 hypothetical protein N0B40_18515 [Chryseobacterium oranimense]